MSFVFALRLIFADAISLEDFSSQFLNLEEIFLKNFPNREYDFSENEIILYNPDFMDSENISFKDYIEEWKILKNFLIENQLATEENYKNFFKIKKIEFHQNDFPDVTKLDSLIAQVDKNDPKLLEVLEKIQKIQKK